MNKSICLDYIEICMHSILGQKFSLKLSINLDNGEINFVMLKKCFCSKAAPIQVFEAMSPWNLIDRLCVTVVDRTEGTRAVTGAQPTEMLEREAVPQWEPQRGHINDFCCKYLKSKWLLGRKTHIRHRNILPY